MKYRKEDYNVTKTGTTTQGIEFSNLKPVYRLNKATGLLEKTEEVVDIQEMVNSCKDTCLSAVLDRFLPTENEVNEAITVSSELKDKTDFLQEAFMQAEEFKSKYNLDKNLSIQEVFTKVKELSKIADARVEELKNKEVLLSEKKKTIEGEEQKVIQPNG